MRAYLFIYTGEHQRADIFPAGSIPIHTRRISFVGQQTPRGSFLGRHRHDRECWSGILQVSNITEGLLKMLSE